jgi:Mg2+ and Co2+ transporter CorA
VGSIDFATFGAQLRRLRSSWSDIDLYASEVNTAIIGIEAMPDVDEAAARELNDYADQLERLEGRLQECSRWGAELMQDYSAGVAQHQAEQINRLTVVAMIFVPLTFLEGLFAMNFDWLNHILRGMWSFLILGVAAPIVTLAATLIWLKRWGLIWPARKDDGRAGQ